MHTFTTTVEDFHSNLWRYHFLVPDVIAEKYIEGDNRRVVCTIGEDVKIQSALMPSKNGWFILMNNQIREKLGVKEGDQITVKIIKDTSTFGLPIPESFSVLLEQDEHGAMLFNSLTMGKQRSLVYIVGKVKNIDSQINKGLAILEHLKEMNGNLDFKKLNIKIKAYNNRGKIF